MFKNKTFATLAIALIIFYNLPSYSFNLKKTFTRSGEDIYTTQCLFCHNGTVKEAPRFEALQNLTSTSIVKSLTTGVMKAQGASLSAEEKDMVAKYISKIGSQEKTLMTGMCYDLTPKSIQNNKQKISSWGMGLKNQRFINDKDILINVQNAGKLSLKWAFAFPEATCARSQPTVAGNTLFTSSQQGIIYAIDTKTGCIRWTFQAENEVRSAISIEFDKNNNAVRLYFGDFKANVYALDIKTNRLIWKKKVEQNDQATITGSLTFYQNRLYVPVSSSEVISAYNPKYECCKFRGSVVSLNAKTGKEIWKTYTVDEPNPTVKNSAGTQNFGPSGAPIWSCPTIDVKRGFLYVGTGENYSIPATGTSDAIIALSLATGKIQWIRQTINQDAWNAACTMPNGANCPPNHGPDFDFGAPPILVNQKEQGDLILAGQKSGMVYAMNPDKNGEIVWQARVGRGGIMGGIHWGMASDEKTLFVPVNDREAYAEDQDKQAFSGLHAVNIADGKFIWSKILENKCGDAKWSCGSGLSAAITLANDVIFAGSLDGVFRAFSSKNGNILWEFETKREFETVNGVKGYGGTIDSAGAIVVANQVFTNSGYAKFGEKAGNVLLCFEVK